MWRHRLWLACIGLYRIDGVECFVRDCSGIGDAILVCPCKLLLAPSREHDGQNHQRNDQGRVASQAWTCRPPHGRAPEPLGPTASALTPPAARRESGPSSQ